MWVRVPECSQRELYASVCACVNELASPSRLALHHTRVYHPDMKTPRWVILIAVIPMLIIGIGVGGWALYCLPVEGLPDDITILPLSRIGMDDVEYEMPANPHLLWLYPRLRYLDCRGVALTKLDVSANTTLQTLLCSGNDLTELDVSANSFLFWLDCDGNQFTELDVSSNTILFRLVCPDNNLTELSLSQNPFVAYLNCSDNSITGVLDVSFSTNLQYVAATNNAITELIVWDTNSLHSRVDAEDYWNRRGIFVDPGVVIREP